MKNSSISLKEKNEESFHFHYKKFLLKLCVAAPCILLFLIILFVYAVYQNFYIIPLLSETYWYDINPNSQLTDYQFPVFKQIIRYQEKFIFQIYSFRAQELEKQEISHFSRGLILILIEHYLLFWLVYSLVKTIKTDPGGAPELNSPWNIKISEIMENYKNNEIKNFRRLKKNKNQQTLNSATNAPQNMFPSIMESVISDHEEQKCENDQGRQGTNSEKSANITQESDEDSNNVKDDEFSEHEKMLISIRALEQARRKENLRYCQHCHHFKPLRTHHCQQCMKCISKMDHHCQWLLTCIGLKNYKFFMNTLIYADLNLIFIGSTFTRCVMDVALNPYIEGVLIYLILFCIMLIVVLFILISGFLIFHLWLILTAKTSLEYCEKWKRRDGLESKKINFDEGCGKNFTNVFNRNPLLWFFPFNPNFEGDGLFEEFEKQNLGEL